MELDIKLIATLTLLQFSIVYFFNVKEVRKTGVNKGSRGTASAVHSLMFGLFATIVCPPILFEQYSLLGSNTYETDLIGQIAISYFLSHIAFVLVLKRINSELIHHLICLFALFYAISTQEYGQDLTLTIFLGEITFFLHLGLIAKNRNAKRMENLCNDIFVWTFTPLRLIVFPIYLFFFLNHRNTDFIVGLMAVFFILSGFYFAYRIMGKWQAKDKERFNRYALSNGKKIS